MPVAEILVTDSVGAVMISQMSSLEEAEPMILSWLEQAEDDEIVQFIASCEKSSAVIRRLRGRAVNIRLERQSSRLPGGRGNKDEKGMGRTALISKMADELGVSPSTLRKDAAIDREFFAGVETIPVTGQVYSDVPDYVLDIALGAPDKEQAVELFRSKSDTNERYSEDQFRADVQQMKNGASAEKLETNWHINFPLPCETKEIVLNYANEHSLLPSVALAKLVEMGSRLRDFADMTDEGLWATRANTKLSNETFKNNQTVGEFIGFRMLKRAEELKLKEKGF